MESLHRMAVELADEAIDFADELGIGARHLGNDAVVIDFGVEHEGGIEAGLLLAELATGGLATVRTRMDTVGGAPLPHVELSTDHPHTALLAAQRAEWTFEEIDGIGGGPARIEAEDPDFAVLALEATDLPGEAVAREVAERTGVPTSGVFLAVAPLDSVAGSVGMAARAAEVALHRFERIGGDPDAAITATASAPVPPLAGDEDVALARTNDALAYGADAHLIVADAPADLSGLAFGDTDAAGASFADLLDGRDVEAARDRFAPARVTVDERRGPTRVVGERDESALAERLGL